MFKDSSYIVFRVKTLIYSFKDVSGVYLLSLYSTLWTNFARCLRLCVEMLSYRVLYAVRIGIF